MAEGTEHPRRGLLCGIYKNGTDCSNSGISSRCTQVVLVGPGIPEIFAATVDAPAVELRMLGGAVNAKPVDDDRWWMFGGCFIYTSDSRFPADQPIPLHDRTETEDLARVLSR